MSELIMHATVGVALVDGLLAGGLLWVYAKSYRAVKAPFTMGLMLFAGLFVAQNALAAYSYLTFMMYFPDPVQPFGLAVMALEALALSVMLYSANQ